MSLSTESTIVVINYRAQPGQEELARRELADLIATVVENEPACSGITMLEDADDPTRLLLYEVWTDKEAYLGPHMKTPHILAFIQRAPQFMAGPPKISFWKGIAEV